MSDKPLQLEFGTSNAVSPEENILRGMFTFFLNQGGFDERMRAAHLSPESKRTDHVGAAFFKIHKDELRQEFLSWAKTEPLANYLLANESVLDAFRCRFKEQWIAPFDAILGARFKEVTGFNRKALPKDLKKSFYTKAYNRLVKFCQEYSQSGHGVADVRTDYQDSSGKARVLSVEEWLQLALSKKGKNKWFQSENLREIRNLYWKMISHEPMDDVVRELMNQASVAGVMLS